MTITDCHIHIQPAEMFKAAALEVMKKARGHYDDILEYCRSPKVLLKYLDSIGVEELETIYRAAEANGIPVMVHTGTSIFPAARNKYGDPIYLDDVAVDFPKLRILMAHGGRPIWMQTAFFLLRRHRNVHLDISGIPPKLLLTYFPRLKEIARKTLFGTDWPSPGIPDIGKNLEQFRDLPLKQEIKEQILSKTALEMWPS